MENYKYMTLHDLRAILNIYEDCLDYKIRVWNFTDYCYFHLWSKNLLIDINHYGPNQSQIIMDASKKFKLLFQDYHLVTVRDLKKITDDIYNNCPGLDDAKIEIFNTDNHRYMNIVFTGSSNVDKEVSFNIEYTGGYKEIKRRLRWKYITTKYIFKKTYRELKNKLYGRR